jgi:D-alanine-D-alanine ligase
MDSSESLNWPNWERVREADLVFNALHGGKGENGTVQALLETAGLIYTGAGILGSSLAMNKDRSKALMIQAGVATADHIFLDRVNTLELSRVEERITDELRFPVVVKPNSQGSSVGFSFVEESSQLEGAIARGLEFDTELIIEKYIPGRELTVAVLGDRPLPPVEIIPEGGFYNYKCKYTKGCSRYVVPAEIEPETSRKLKEDAMAAFGALRCRDYARIDFRVGQRGDTYCLELNTLPGMTELSLVPMAAAEEGILFDLLIERICLLALKRSGHPKGG